MEGQKYVSLEHQSEQELGNGLALDDKIRILSPLTMTRLKKVRRTKGVNMV